LAAASPAVRNPAHAGLRPSAMTGAGWSRDPIPALQQNARRVRSGIRQKERAGCKGNPPFRNPGEILPCFRQAA